MIIKNNRYDYKKSFAHSWQKKKRFRSQNKIATNTQIKMM